MSKRRSDEISDDSDTGSDLEDFIVQDSEYKKSKKTKLSQEDDENDDNESEDSAASELEAEPVPDADGPELTEVLKAEASKITEGMKTTTVGGRTLRDRSAIQKPKDPYWEKYGSKDYEKLMELDEKKELLDEIRKWKRDIDSKKIEISLPDDFKWPVLTVKDSLEAVKAGHHYVMNAMGLEESDDENEDEEKSIHTDDESEDVDEDDLEDDEESEESEGDESEESDDESDDESEDSDASE